MPVQSVVPILNVSHLGESFAWFEIFGWQRGFSWNDGGFMGSGAEAPASNEHGEANFGSVCSGHAQIFLCRGGQGARGNKLPEFPGDESTGGVWMSWWVDSPEEVDALYAKAVASGCTVSKPPANEPWGIREFHLRHPDGHVFRVGAGVGEPE